MLFATLFISLLASVSALPTPAESSVFRVLATTQMEAASMPQAPPPSPIDEATEESTSSPTPTASPEPSPHPAAEPQLVAFDSCPIPEGGSSPAGVVNNITVSPCSRSSDSEPCHFHYGQNYTIDISYTSYLNSELPRSGLSARDDSTDPSTQYPYSGQTFDSCAYTDCPVQAGETSVFSYRFNTLLSPFNYLTFNMTQSIEGPSLFCAGFDAQFVDTEGEEAAPKTKTIKNPKKAEQPLDPEARR
ncbi:hypothetical protein JCM5353_004781 [Sporobolomyces roseus]